MASSVPCSCPTTGSAGNARGGLVRRREMVEMEQVGALPHRHGRARPPTPRPAARTPRRRRARTPDRARPADPRTRAETARPWLPPTGRVVDADQIETGEEGRPHASALPAGPANRPPASPPSPRPAEPDPARAPPGPSRRAERRTAPRRRVRARPASGRHAQDGDSTPNRLLPAQGRFSVLSGGRGRTAGRGGRRARDREGTRPGRRLGRDRDGRPAGPGVRQFSPWGQRWTRLAAGRTDSTHPTG